jgi:hypothetical protein
MQPTDVNPCIMPSFTEFAGIEHILLRDLRSLLSEPVTEQSRLWIEKLLDMLLDVLPGQFAAEEADGYLQDVLETCPQWRRRVLRLRRQHGDLSLSLAELRAELNNSHLAPRHAAKVRNGLWAWMDRYQSHQDAEMRLLQMEGTHAALAS